MREPKLEDEKDKLISALTDAYAQGRMDMAAFERSVTRISASVDRSALEGEAAALGLALSQPARDLRPASALSPAHDAEVLRGTSGSIRKEGDWVRARRYRLELKASSARLDLSDYECERGFRLEIELDAVSSSLRLIVPRGFEVEDRISDNRSSSVRNRPKGDAFGDNRVLITGALRSSVVKVKYR